MCSPGWQQKYDKVEKTNEPFRDDASPRHGFGPKVLHNTNFLLSSRYTSPVLFMKYFVLFSPIQFFVFLHSISSRTVSRTAFSGDYSSEVDECSFLQVQNTL